DVREHDGDDLVLNGDAEAFRRPIVHLQDAFDLLLVTLQLGNDGELVFQFLAGQGAVEVDADTAGGHGGDGSMAVPDIDLHTNTRLDILLEELAHRYHLYQLGVPLTSGLLWRDDDLGLLADLGG